MSEIFMSLTRVKILPLNHRTRLPMQWAQPFATLGKNLDGTIEFDLPNASPAMEFSINNINGLYSPPA